MDDPIDIIYDRYGKPVLRLFNNGRFVTFGGESVGFLENKNAYNYEGKHVGWYEDGILRDHHGRCAGFGENPIAIVKPFLPFKQFVPFAGFVQFEPFRPYRQFTPFRPIDSYGWSQYEAIQLFFSISIMPNNNTNTTELTIPGLVNDSISEKKKEIRSLRKSLKQEQDKTTELRERISHLESDNNLLCYKTRRAWVKDIFKTIYSALFGAGISLFVTPSELEWYYKLAITILGLAGYILTLLIDDKNNDK